MAFDIPDRGFVFWPVGTGDSATIKVDDDTVVQVDVRHMVVADDDDDEHAAVVDRLIDEVLPERNSEPYLSVFVLTHADKDHCQGFEDLLDRVEIGELWMSPRVFRDYDENADLCDDAVAFRDEALRRIGKNQGEEAASGDRIRVIGEDDILEEDQYADIPESLKTRPGETITELDGDDVSDRFEAFMHAPFGDDSTRDRNKTSIGMRVTLTDGDGQGRAMLLGDLDYPPLKRIFVEYGDQENRACDVLLAPHHCSKSAMYFEEPEDDGPVLKQDVLDGIEDAFGDTGWVVASSDEIPAVDEPGDNPPHAYAKERYEEIAPDGFLCTGDGDADDPIVFSVGPGGIELTASPESADRADAGQAVRDARGTDKAAVPTSGFGSR